MKMFRLYGLMLLVLLLALPVSAQSIDDPTVIYRENGIILVLLVIIVALLIAVVYLARQSGLSVPQNVVKDIFDAVDKSVDRVFTGFRNAANMTPTFLDNSAVDMGVIAKEAAEKEIRKWLGIPEGEPIPIPETGAQKVVYQTPSGAEITVERIAQEPDPGETKPPEEPKG